MEDSIDDEQDQSSATTSIKTLSEQDTLEEEEGRSSKKRQI